MLQLTNNVGFDLSSNYGSFQNFATPKKIKIPERE